MEIELASIYRRLKSDLQLRLQVVYHKRYHLRPLLNNAYEQKLLYNAYEKWKLQTSIQAI
jgi:hypothetical protein